MFEASDFDDPTLSPDGRTIALSSNRIRFWNLHLLHLETLELSALTTAEETDLHPIFFPGGRWIASQRQEGGDLDWDVINVDGTCLRNLTQT